MGMITPTKAKFSKNDINLGQGPPSGLTPVGDTGIYMTPDEPADVFDCERYPDSIYCGGNPLSITPIGIDANLEIDNCGATIQATPIVAFIKLPPLSVSYRLPGECRNEYEKKRDGKLPKFDAPSPETFGCADLNLFDIDDEKTVYAFVSGQFAGVNNPNKICDSGFVISEYQENNSCFEFLCPGTPVNIAGTARVTEVSCSARSESTTSNVAGPFDSKRNCHVGMAPNQAGDFTSRAYFTLDDRIDYYISTDGRVAYYERPRSNFTSTVDNSVPRPWYKIQRSDTETTSYAIIYKGKWGLLKAFLARPPVMFSLEARSMAGKVVDHPKFYQNVCFSVIEAGCKVVPRTLNYQLPPPPPPPPPKKECCVSCCSPSQQQDQKDYMPILQQILKEAQTINKSVGIFPTNATLFDSNEDAQEAQTTTVQIGSVSQAISRIIERTEKVSKIIGIDALPLTVPESIADPVNDNIFSAVWDALTPDATRKINNLFELNVWMVEQFSAVMGHWQLDIEVAEDKPKATEGEEQPPTPKPKKIVLPDVRACFKELLMLNIQQYKIQGLILDVVLKDLTETSSTKKEVVAAQMNIREIVDFLDYQTDQDSVSVPVQISVPGADLSQEDQNNLHKYLQPSEVKVRYDKWNGRKSLNDLFIHLSTLIGRK
jgi:hypothetical protein